MNSTKVVEHLNRTFFRHIHTDPSILKCRAIEWAPMKNVKHIFSCAEAYSEAMVIDRILVRVLPELVKYDQRLTADNIKADEQIWIPDDLYTHIREVAEELVGHKCVNEPGTHSDV